MLKREAEMIKREERLENVTRIAKANEYQNKIVSDKIEYDKIKGDMIMKEKSDMLNNRFSARREAEVQKRLMLKNVEDMKKKGGLTKDVFRKLGLEGINEEPNSPY